MNDFRMQEKRRHFYIPTTPKSFPTPKVMSIASMPPVTTRIIALVLFAPPA